MRTCVKAAIGKRIPIILPIDSYVKFTDLKNSYYLTIPDPGKGLPSFESVIQALSKNHMKGFVLGAFISQIWNCLQLVSNQQ